MLWVPGSTEYGMVENFVMRQKLLKKKKSGGEEPGSSTVWTLKKSNLKRKEIKRNLWISCSFHSFTLEDSLYLYYFVGDLPTLKFHVFYVNCKLLKTRGYTILVHETKHSVGI